MKRIFLITFLAPFTLLAQKNPLLQKADSCYNARDYKNAANYSRQFYSIDSSCDGCTYNAACYHALAGDTASAIIFLKKSLELGYASLYLEKDEDLLALHAHSHWAELQKKSAETYKKNARERAERSGRIAASYEQWQHNWERNFRTGPGSEDTGGTAKQVYAALKQFNRYRQPATMHQYLYFYQPVNDSIKVPYMVWLPPEYNPKKAYPLLVILHGAVRVQATLPAYADSSMTMSFHRHFTKYAREANMIIVIPYANRQYNWMYPDSGFNITPAIVQHLKRFINIDDDAVSLTGHSNGATGSFSYLLKQPGLFAGFSGMNTQPVIRTGGTFLPNAHNRNFYNIATSKDYYFPPAANDSISKLAQKLNLGWTTDMQNGYPHWFPDFNMADEPVKKMFSSMLQQRRNPFQHKLYWECDDITYGRCDWLAITALDTLQNKAAWHQQYNFIIPYWIDNMNPDRIIDSSSIAFRYPRRSGALEANYSDNVFRISSSRLKTLRIFLSPEMIDLSRPVIVYLNGRKVFEKKMGYNKTFMLKNFSENPDRKAVWINYVDIPLSSSGSQRNRSDF